MSRCKACDTILTEFEMKRIDFNTDAHLDLCYNCMVVSNRALLEEDGEVEQTIDETLAEIGIDLSNN